MKQKGKMVKLTRKDMNELLKETSELLKEYERLKKIKEQILKCAEMRPEGDLRSPDT